MPYGTILDSGRLVSAGSVIRIPCVQGASWLKVVNYTEATAANANHGVEYFWQLGMTANDCLVSLRNAGATAMNTSTAITLGVPGVTLIDTSLINTVSVATVLTGITNAAPGVVATADTHTAGLATGDIVRLYDVVGGNQLSGIDFTVGNVILDTSFTLANMAAIVAVAAPGATAVWRKIPYDAYFYPTHRYISKIRAWPTDTTKTQITLTVTHGYQIGQQVRFVIPAAYGMTQLNGLQGTIVQMNVTDNTGSTNTIIVDTPVTGFTAFAFPLSAAVPFSPAMVVPIGMNTSEALYPVPPLPIVPPYDNLTDATLNTANKYLVLGAGITSPAGSNNDVLFWSIGTSYSL